MLSTLKHATL